MWAILVVTLPTQPNAVRLRIWRALKALGCAALRGGAYLLPAAHGGLFEPLAAEVREHGGTAARRWCSRCRRGTTPARRDGRAVRPQPGLRMVARQRHGAAARTGRTVRNASAAPVARRDGSPACVAAHRLLPRGCGQAEGQPTAPLAAEEARP